MLDLQRFKCNPFLTSFHTSHIQFIFAATRISIINRQRRKKPEKFKKYRHATTLSTHRRRRINHMPHGKQFPLKVEHRHTLLTRIAHANRTQTIRYLKREREKKNEKVASRVNGIRILSICTYECVCVHVCLQNRFHQSNARCEFFYPCEWFATIASQIYKYVFSSFYKCFALQLHFPSTDSIQFN